MLSDDPRHRHVTMSESESESQAILVLAPLGRDAELACKILTAKELRCRPCHSVGELSGHDLEIVSAIVLTEEILTPSAVKVLAGLLQTQPAWSNLPIIIFTERCHGGSSLRDKDLRDAFGAAMDVVMLERPIHVASFVSIVQSAVLARHRQYELRDQLDAREKAETQAQMLAEEMKHRVKNSLTVIGAIASRTFRGAISLEEALKSFSDRLAAMSRAQDILTSSGHASADLHELVEHALAPYGETEGGQAFIVVGPVVQLNARAATALAMALHELSTNAAKYGALSTASGKVSIDWRVNAEPNGRQLYFDWVETGGPVVTPPKRRGFGSTLVEQALSYELGGHAKLSFKPVGVSCSICANLG